MIDLHMHIIPDVDDGSGDLEMSEQMLRMAIEQGIEVVFATSHSMAHREDTEYTRHQYRKLQKMVKDKRLPIKVYLGCEVLYDIRCIDQILKDLETGRLPSINETKYVLTELFHGLGKNIMIHVNKMMERGWIPVIAHAERIDDLTIDIIREMKAAGCLIQINAYSIAEEKNDVTRNRALELLENRLVDFVGSDAHRLNHRPPGVKAGMKYLYEHFEEEYVDDILYNNVMNLILNVPEADKEIESDIWIDGMMGVITGDALGIPVQFLAREEVQKGPIFTMDGFGTYDMPIGTWSDDGSMALATLDSIDKMNGINYYDVMCRFVAWTAKVEYTPAGVAFDQGNTCMEAICNYVRNRDYKTCGKTGEYTNGNGGLMRIMPVCLYSYVQYKNGLISLKDAVECVHQATALTHNHMRAKMASGIYFFMICSILDCEGALIQKLQKGMDNAAYYYKADIMNLTEWTRFGRMITLAEFATITEDEIKSSGYVVDSLEAAVWSLITSESLEEGLLKAVNLGDDTDTVGAIAGGLAGLRYDYNRIPETWRKVIIKKNEIIALCENVKEKFYVR